MNSSIVETDKTHLTRDDHSLLKELLRPGAAIEAVIPADASGGQLWDTLQACVRGLNLMEARMCRLKPIIGRILLLFENKPSLYKDLGYDSYSDFMQKGCYETLGLHRSSAYEGKLAARDWPQLDPDRYAKVGPKKLSIISKFAKGNSPNAELHLHNAETMTVGAMRQYYEQRGYLEKGETVGAVILITTNRAVETEVLEFFNDPRVHRKVNSKDRGEILRAMVQECYVEWVNEGQEGGN